MQLLVQQFVILLWKCGILRKRHYISTAFEIILPLLISSVLTILVAQLNITGGNPSRDTNKPAEWKNRSTFQYPGLQGFARYKTKILFSPKSDFNIKLINSMNETIKQQEEYIIGLEFRGFDTEQQLVDYYFKAKENESDHYTQFFGIVVEGSEPLKNFHYTIRCREEDMEDPQKIYNFYVRPGWTSNYQSDFSRLQLWINEAYLNVITGDAGTNENRTVTGYMYPYPAYNADGDVKSIGILSMFIVMGFVVTAPILVKRLADEKNSRCREMYRLMGLNDWTFWGSTFTNYFLVYFVQAIILTFLYCTKFNGNASVFNHVNPLLVFVTFLLYGISFILQSMLLSVPFNRPIIGVIVTILFWMNSYIIPMVFLDLTIPAEYDITKLNTGRIMACLLPNAALYFIFRIINARDMFGVETNFSNLFGEVYGMGSVTYGVVLLMMLASCVLYGILIWYLENIWPWQYGVPKPVYYIFLPSYWCGGRKTETSEEGRTGFSNKFFERQLSLAEVAVNVKSLRKEFGVGFSRKVAINDASLEINRGQITVLLGHNGAGKTTMMNIITGMFTPSGGNVYVDGYDIKTQTKDARKSMSLCPQHNIIYDELTVSEHLKLFAGIKGSPLSTMSTTIEKCARQLNLIDKLNVPSSELSGGMKRKLNLGIALIGDTSVVILDEPTSGMDPDARRTVWDFLQSIRRERTILITTHFMEEADALADRIAIMVDGEVKCCGTPMFLKSAFGSGYQLRIAKMNSFNGNAVHDSIVKYFPNATVVNETDSEMVYRLQENNESEENSNYNDELPQFFNEFELKKPTLGIASFGLSVTTIEDVFLGVHSEKKSSEDEALPLRNREQSSEMLVDCSNVQLAGDSYRLTGFPLILQQLKALLLKRVHFTRRYLMMFIFQLIIPALIFALTLSLDSSSRKTDDSLPKLRLSLGEIYGETTTFFQSSNETENFNKLYENFAKSESATTVFLDSSANITDVILSAANSTSLLGYKKKYVVSAAATNQTAFNIYYNSEDYQSIPVAINLFYNMILKSVNPSSSENSISISVQAFKVNRFIDPFFSQYNALTTMSLVWSLLVPLALPFIAASYVMYPIHERESKSKLLQLMTGVHPVLFWVANFIFDFVTHLLCCCVILAIFGGLDRYGYFMVHSDSAAALFVILFFFGIVCIPLAYLASFMFKSTGTGFAVLVIILVVFGLVLSPIDYAMKSAPPEKYRTYEWFVRLSPIVALSKGIVNIREVTALPNLCASLPADYLEKNCNDMPSMTLMGCCKELCTKFDSCYEYRSPFSWQKNVINYELLMMCVDAIIFIVLLCFLEYGFSRIIDLIQTQLNKSSNNDCIDMDDLNGTEDVDAKEEATRVAQLLRNQNIDSDSLIVHKLRKEYEKRLCGCVGLGNSFLAVKKLSFAVQNKECFGLLGVNGAGKTTTFRMLVGDLMPTCGNAYSSGADIVNNCREFQSNVGYCPQFDALLDKLTGTETLYLFGRLRGIPEAHLKTTVQELTVMTNLGKHSEKRTETYSGGTRRKLSLAMALIGNPKLLFLDEPTSGVDPSARRIIWNTLKEVREVFGCSLILTSHSMDECEVLCNRIAIMVNGEFKCLGNFQHLRSKFGQGFTLKIKVKRNYLNADYINSIKHYVSTVITSAVLKDLSETVFEYHITDVTLAWSKLFTIMSEMKRQYDLEDYTISDATLEQIFISFARQQSV